MTRHPILALCAVGCLGLPSLGCSNDSAPSCDTGGRYFYLIDLLEVPDPSSGAVAGFDVDDTVSDGSDPDSCNHVDFTGPRGEPGIDNQLAPIADSIRSEIDVNATLRDTIGDGRLAVVLEVDDVDDLTNDDCVSLTLSLGYPPAGAPMAPEVDSDGRPVPGQTYDYRPLASAEGRIVAGRVETDPFEVSAMVTLVDPPVALDLRDVQIAFDIGPQRLSAGMIGGGLEVAQLQAVVEALQPDYAAVAEVILEQNADLDASGGGCAAISAGFGFEAVQAVQGTERPPE